MAIRRTLTALSIIGAAVLAALAGCAGGAVCFRNSDCPSGNVCQSGVCALPPPSDAGEAGLTNPIGADASSTSDASTSDVSDAGDAGDASQNADAG